MYLHKTYILPKRVKASFFGEKKRQIMQARHSFFSTHHSIFSVYWNRREKIQYCLVSTTLYFSPQIRKMYYWLKIYFSGKLWATLDQCFHHAMVPNFVFNMSTKRISSESMGLNTFGGQWSLATNCFGHMEGSRRVSAYEIKNKASMKYLTTFA